MIISDADFDAALLDALAKAGAHGLRASDFFLVGTIALKRNKRKARTDTEMPVDAVKRRLHALRARGAVTETAGYWCLASVQPLYHLSVTTYLPSKYVLLNAEDGSVWRGSATGWLRGCKPDVPPEIIRVAAIASAGGAAEWEHLGQRAQQEALADCAVIVRSAFAALDLEAICASYYARTGNSLDRLHLQAVLEIALGGIGAVGATDASVNPNGKSPTNKK